MIDKIKNTIGILLALAIISVFGYLLYQPLAKSLGFPPCCELRCKIKGYPTGSCKRPDETGPGDIHEKHAPCWDPLDEHCSFFGICRCMCEDPNADFEL